MLCSRLENKSRLVAYDYDLELKNILILISKMLFKLPKVSITSSHYYNSQVLLLCVNDPIETLFLHINCNLNTKYYVLP